MAQIKFPIPKICYNYLRKPMGTLYTSTSKKNYYNIIKKKYNKLLISIGDVTTGNLLKIGIFPNICIIDGFTRRKRFNIISIIKLKNKYIFYYMRNDAGFLSLNVILFIRNIFKTNKLKNQYICIVINGEEDLLLLPIVLFSSRKSIILYGQPRKGVVVVTPKQNIKKKCLKVIS